MECSDSEKNDLSVSKTKASDKRGSSSRKSRSQTPKRDRKARLLWNIVCFLLEFEIKRL